MRITSTLNNEKIKFLYSWVDFGYENNGIDVLVTEKGKVIIICWKTHNRETTIW